MSANVVKYSALYGALIGETAIKYRLPYVLEKSLEPPFYIFLSTASQAAQVCHRFIEK